MSKNNILHYAIPNGGSRNLLEALKLKRMGVKSGVPDICIPIARGSFHGLYIELKRCNGGKVSENQQSWIDKLNNEGYVAVIAYGLEEAKKIVLKYLAYDDKVCA